MKRTPVIALILIGLWGCDTSRNVDDPNLLSFTRFIGTDGHQAGQDIVVMSDGSLILLGNTWLDAAQSQQLYIVRTTPEGYVLWEQKIGSNEEARDAELLSDGGIGILSMTLGERDFVLRRITADGTVTNSITYGIPGYAEEAYTLTETSDSYFVTGYTTNVPVPNPPAPNPADAMVVRFFKDFSLHPTWTTTVGGTIDFDVAIRTFEVGQDFYLFGHSNGVEPGNDAVLDYNPFVWILGSSGVVSASTFIIGNSKIVGSVAGADETVSSVALVPGGGYIMAGYSVDRTTGNQQMFSIRIRQDLQNIPNTDIDQILAVQPLAFGSPTAVSTSTKRASIFPSQGFGFLMLGSESLGNNENLFLKKLDNNLTDAWQSPPFFSFGGVGTDTPGAVAETADGRIILLGTMVLGESDARGQQKMVLMKLSPEGKLGQ